VSQAKTPETPAGIVPHQADYKPNAWDQYTMAELGHWVHLLSTRAGHRDNAEKKAKDLSDAQNYLDMMQAKLNALKG
jgi:hypothetical protein